VGTTTKLVVPKHVRVILQEKVPNGNISTNFIITSDRKVQIDFVATGQTIKPSALIPSIQYTRRYELDVSDRFKFNTHDRIGIDAGRFSMKAGVLGKVAITPFQIRYDLTERKLSGGSVIRVGIFSGKAYAGIRARLDEVRLNNIQEALFRYYES
jgi:hypothetical protein